jgi:signal transduction histidine kinase/DNA-binding response OmpR family regulator
LVSILNQLSYEYQWVDFNKSLDYANRALKLADSLSYKKGMAEASYRSAHSFWALGNAEVAIEKGLDAVKLGAEINAPKIIAEANRVLAMCYRDQQDIETARVCIQQAIDISTKQSDWDLLSRSFNVAGIIMHHQNNDDSAIYLYEKALEISSDHRTPQFHVSHILSNMAECYLATDIDKSLVLFKRALQSAIETNNKSAEAGITADLGKVYMMMNDFPASENYSQLGLSKARKLNLKRVVRYSYSILAELKVRERKLDDAIQYMRLYNDLNDSLLNINQTRQIVELERRYETERKEQRILLLEQERRIARIWRYVLISGSIFLLVALLIIYRLQAMKTLKAKDLLTTQEKLNQHLKETDSLKSKFFANISHEFRTPLSLIIAPTDELLSRQSKGSKDKTTFQLIRRNADRLLTLVNQLLDLSKLEAGKMELTIQTGNLADLITILSASFNSLAENKEIEFIKEINVSNQSSILFDADKLEKIINNLLFNAFKFTPKFGKVTLKAVCLTDSNELQISVADTGRGIPIDDQAAVFSPFYQSKHTQDDGQVGTGLGLSLVSELVKVYSGSISMESEEGKGTIFKVILPTFKEGWIAASDWRNDMATQHRTVENANDDNIDYAFDMDELDSMLIIEDNADLRNFIASAFAGKYTITTAKDGVDGLQKALGEIPNIIISDVMMPNMDGIELVGKLKSDERTSHIPLVLLTAKSDMPSKLEGLTMGVDAYLEKPFSVEELKVRVSALLEQRKQLTARFKESALKEQVEVKEKREPSLDEKFLNRVRECVEANLADPKFGVEMLAEEMNLSRTQLFRKFKAIVDVSPSEFINEIRLQRAAKMIRYKEDTLAQICYSVGFNEQSYFAKRFRKKFGKSPSEYAESFSG